jgi:hypothetical protein
LGATEMLQEDSVKKLSIDRFWIGLGGSIVVLAILWFALLLPKAAQRSRLHAELETKAKELERAVMGTPSRKDVLDWARYKANLLQSRSVIAAFYADHSKALRQWFPKLPLAPDGEPPRDAFVGRYQDEAQALEEALTQRAQPVAVGGTDDEKAPGFHWEDLSIDHWDALGRQNEKIVLRELQKRYWARQRVANVALHSRVPLKRIVDFRFFKRLHEKFPEGGVQPGEIPLAQWPSMTPQPSPETAVPNDLIRPFTFGFAVELPYSEVPNALREFVSSGGEASSSESMLVTLLGTHLTIRDQNAPKVDFLYDEGDEDQKTARAKAIEKSSKPRTVILTVTCQIVDYEPKELTSK